LLPTASSQAPIPAPVARALPPEGAPAYPAFRFSRPLIAVLKLHTGFVGTSPHYGLNDGCRACFPQHCFFWQSAPLLRKLKPRLPSLGVGIGAAFSHFDACGRAPVTEIDQPHVSIPRDPFTGRSLRSKRLSGGSPDPFPNVLGLSHPPIPADRGKIANRIGPFLAKLVRRPSNFRERCTFATAFDHKSSSVTDSTGSEHRPDDERAHDRSSPALRRLSAAHGSRRDGALNARIGTSEAQDGRPVAQGSLRAPLERRRLGKQNSPAFAQGCSFTGNRTRRCDLNSTIS
jgi:hypothetical protein